MRTIRLWPCGLVFIALAAKAAPERIMDFDRDKAPGAPQGWVSEGAPWRVVAERQAASPPNVLMPPRSVLTGGLLTQVRVSSSVFLNGDVGVRFRTTQEEPAAVFGLLWSYQDGGNYEEVQVNTQNNLVTLSAVHNGKGRVLSHESLVFTPNTWHLLQVQAGPKKLIVYLDNDVVLAGKSALRRQIGQVGLSVVPSSPLQLDDFAWRAR